MIVDIVGYIGMVLLLLAWYLSRTKYKLSARINFIGGIVMAIWALLLWPSAIPAVVLNTAWTIIGIFQLWKLRENHEERKQKKNRR